MNGTMGSKDASFQDLQNEYYCLICSNELYGSYDQNKKKSVKKKKKKKKKKKVARLFGIGQ